MSVRSAGFLLGEIAQRKHHEPIPIYSKMEAAPSPFQKGDRPKAVIGHERKEKFHFFGVPGAPERMGVASGGILPYHITPKSKIYALLQVRG